MNVKINFLLIDINSNKNLILIMLISNLKKPYNLVKKV